VGRILGQIRRAHGWRALAEKAPAPFDFTAGYSRAMALSDEKYIRVTTFKKDGTEVSTPT